MEDHVNWAEKMDARVLINDRWYKVVLRRVLMEAGVKLSPEGTLESDFRFRVNSRLFLEAAIWSGIDPER